jgi:DNA repair protein RadC
MPKDERPRERLLLKGADVLSDAELLAIMLRVGNAEETAVGLAQRILKETSGLRGLAEKNQDELTQIKGIGPAKVAQIKGALELGKRLYEAKRRENKTIRTPEDAAQFVMAEMRYLDREQLRVLCLDSKNHVIANSAISVGTANASLAHPRECFKEAVRRSAVAVIFVHNHPSGDPTPSSEDVQLTKQLKSAADVLGIDLLDHIIIGDGVWMSLKERGLM